MKLLSPEEELDALQTVYGYRPDPERENWKIHEGTLFVADPDRPPRMYRRGCKGAYVEITPASPSPRASHYS